LTAKAEQLCTMQLGEYKAEDREKEEGMPNFTIVHNVCNY